MSQDTVKAALLKTIEGIQQNPEAAKAVFRADTQWVEDVRCTAMVREFAPMTVDEPPELGGGDKAINPVELVLVGLGTCQEIMYAAYASVMGIKLDECKVEVKGYLDLRGLFGMDASIPAGYQKIMYETTLKSPADEASLRTLIDTVEGHCPLLDILTRAQDVSGTATVNGKELHSYASNKRALAA